MKTSNFPHWLNLLIRFISYSLLIHIAFYMLPGEFPNNYIVGQYYEVWDLFYLIAYWMCITGIVEFWARGMGYDAGGIWYQIFSITLLHLYICVRMVNVHAEVVPPLTYFQMFIAIFVIFHSKYSTHNKIDEYKLELKLKVLENYDTFQVDHIFSVWHCHVVIMARKRVPSGYLEWSLDKEYYTGGGLGEALAEFISLEESQATFHEGDMPIFNTKYIKTVQT